MNMEIIIGIAAFGIRFCVCNIVICAIIGILLMTKWFLRKYLTSRMQSTLKISPIEQVELLTSLYNNDFGFNLENVNAVKDSLCLFSSDEKNFYGKTGTGRIDDHDINGWFIGYIETTDETYFFATNIQSPENATGSKASEIFLSILSNMGIWKQ